MENKNMESITLEQAKKKIDKFRNEHLYNFIAQRQCQETPSAIAKYAMDVANDRLAKELAMLWSGRKFKDEPLQQIIDRKRQQQAVK
jgi:hypothetical protein